MKKQVRIYFHKADNLWVIKKLSPSLTYSATLSLNPQTLQPFSQLSELIIISLIEVYKLLRITAQLFNQCRADYGIANPLSFQLGHVGNLMDNSSK